MSSAPAIAPEAEREALESITTEDVRHYTPEQRRGLLAELLFARREMHQHHQLVFYESASEDCKKIHLATERVVGAGGGNRCLPLWSRVAMADGSERELADIEVGDQVLSPDSQASRVVNTYRAGKKAVFHVLCTDGSEFFATAEHEIPVCFGVGISHRAELGKYKVPLGQILCQLAKYPDTPAHVFSPGGHCHVIHSFDYHGTEECGDIEVDHPDHCYVTNGIIVSNSGKTETWMVETATRATGVIPNCMRDDVDMVKAMRFKMERGAVRTRITCASLTTVMPEILIPKLRWTDWIGTGERGGKMGHYGWIPPSSLLGGSWEKAWSEQYRRLTILHRNPDTQEIDGHSYINFMSNDQHPSKFVAGDLDLAYHDEPPTWAIWKEHQARTMGVGGQMGLGMTWPDDPSFPVGWIYDEIYDKAMKGTPGFSWHNLDTTKNRTLDQSAVREQMADWDAVTIKVRIRGGNIRFGGVIHPLFTERAELWCFTCGEVQYKDEKGLCITCGKENLAPFNHVQDFEIRRDWPTFFLLDPHPRKPHMMMWVQVAPDDELWCVAELQVDDDVEVVRDRALALEQDLGLSICQRLIDPKMGAQATSKREIPWVQEFADWGLRCDLADASPVGRERVNRALKPDPDMRRPRIHVHRSCTQCIYQMQRFSWKEHRASLEMAQHQEPKDKDDDYPAMWRYLMNADPHYSVVSHPPQRLTKARRRNRKRI